MSPHSWTKKESPALYTSSHNLMEDNSFSVYEAHMPVVFKSREIAFIEFLRFVYVYNNKIYNVNIGLQEKSKKKSKKTSIVNPSSSVVLLNVLITLFW